MGLQGERRPSLKSTKVTVKDHVLKGWEQVSPGKMTPAQYDAAIGDLVNYMQWMAEPLRTRASALVCGF